MNVKTLQFQSKNTISRHFPLTLEKLCGTSEGTMSFHGAFHVPHIANGSAAKVNGGAERKASKKNRAMSSIANACGKAFSFLTDKIAESTKGLSARISKNIVTKSHDGPSRKIEDVIFGWDEVHINFVGNFCMKKLSECEGAMKLRDVDNVFVGRSEYFRDIPVADARKFGLILPENIDENNANLAIRPLVIRFYGIGSGNIALQFLESTVNVFSSGPKRSKHPTSKIIDELKTQISTEKIAEANAIVLSHIEEEKRKLKDSPNIIIVPFISGFSFGGMLANCIAIRNGFGSIVFNALGIGKSARAFIGNGNWEMANTARANNHMALRTEYDFLSSPMSPLRHIVSNPGLTVTIPGDPKDLLNPVDTHCEYRKKFMNFVAKNVRKNPSHNGH
ncbi:MAG: hypothetical protein LBT64_03580 [Puniceicoccales bacterium]|nr:hypothetical protein [Puniceicoccales bacterium]